MTDEEKKAIEYWKTHMEILHWNTQLASEHYIKVLLDLIEKQQKEIEKLKDINKKLEARKYMLNTITGEVTAIPIDNNYISKDKIKAKIEELEIEQESNREDLRIAIDNLLFQNIDKIADKISINMSVRGILQSLLDKEYINE